MYLGLDIGSSSSKAVILDAEGVLRGAAVINVGTGSTGPEQAVKRAFSMSGADWDCIKKCVCTGYGRLLYQKANKQISEISCHAKGVVMTMRDISTVIDIGGQDAKVICLSEAGKVENFVMNEKCAAGTGRFLEVMARVLDCKLEELPKLAEKGKDGVEISSVCTVFAESEMISQLAAGQLREDVALGAHKSIGQRIAGLAKRVRIRPQITMTGGVALNPMVCRAVEEELGIPVIPAGHPQMMGALGAAGYAMELDGHKAMLKEEERTGE